MAIRSNSSIEKLQLGTNRVLKDHTYLRLDYKTNGWRFVPNDDKKTLPYNWQFLGNTEKDILLMDRWMRFLSTGVRMDGDLVAFDYDIVDPAVMEEVRKRILAIPGFPAPMIVRYGKKGEAWFYRGDMSGIEYPRILTHSFRHPERPEISERGEVYTGRCKARFFGMDGAHTFDRKTRTALLKYRLKDGKGPHNTKRSDLTLVTNELIMAALDETEKVFKEFGYEIVPRFRAGKVGGEHLWTLVDGMRFDCDDHVDRTLQEMRALAKYDHRLAMRCSVSFLEPDTARNRSHCHVHSQRGILSIYDYADANMYFPEEDKPRSVEDLSAAVATLSAKLAMLGIKLQRGAA